MLEWSKQKYVHTSPRIHIFRNSFNICHSTTLSHSNLVLEKIPSKLEVAPAPKCGLDGWVMGDTP